MNRSCLPLFNLRIQIILLSLIGLIVLGVFVGISSIAQQRAALFEANRVRSNAYATNVGFTVDRLTASIRDLDGMEAQVRAVLDSLVADDPAVTFMAVTRTSGDVVFLATNNELGQPTLTSVPAFRDPTEDTLRLDTVAGLGDAYLFVRRFDVARTRHATPLEAVYPFHVVIGISPEAINGQLVENAQAFISVTALAVLIVAGVQFAGLQRNLVRPLNDLMHVARGKQSGDLALRADESRRDEIGEVARAFNTMTDRLDNLIDTLEMRVAERTRDLEIAAYVSKQASTSLAIDELLPMVTRLIATSLDLYIVNIFLYDSEEEDLTLAASASVEGLNKDLSVRIDLSAHPSIIALTARRRTATFVNDTANSPDFLPMKGMEETRSELAVPMLFGGKLLGVFDVQSREVERFSDDDLRVLSTLAERIAVALRNAQLFMETQRARDEAESARRGLQSALSETQSLLQAAQSVLGATELRDVCSRLMQNFLYIAPSDYVALYLVDHEAQEVVFSMYQQSDRAGLDIPYHELKMNYAQLQEGISGQVLKHGQPIISNTPASEPEATRQRRIKNHVGPLVVIPIATNEAVIGTLTLLRREDAAPFRERTVELLSTIGRQAATAIDNLRLFEEMQAARDEAQRANRIKSQFLAAMSHELRTPLNAILNFTRFVADGVMGTVNEQQVSMLREVITSGQHLLSLINDILDISKIEAGAFKLMVDEFDLTKELRTIIASGETLLADKPNVAFRTEIPETLPTMIGDARRVRQIVLNLVSNACKFTQEGYVLLRVLHEVAADTLYIHVEDTGPGIHEEERESVFRVFEQTRAGLNQGSGTGLGLPISKRLAEAHGGHLWFESTVGEGTTFKLSLPITAQVPDEYRVEEA